jgi:hypothetical protein
MIDSIPAEPGRPDSIDPFADPLYLIPFPKFAVVKIGNVSTSSPIRGVITNFSKIPYSATKQEIAHFIGRDAEIIDNNAQGTPIHIIMERSTSKTMDCYIEMKNDDAALNQFKKQWESIMCGKNPRIGTRIVTVEVSTQAMLMRDLFPRAKCVHWEGARPLIHRNTDPYSTGFAGFVTSEETYGMVKHAENPARVSISRF